MKTNSILFSSLSPRTLKTLFYALWTLIGLVQAWGTELFDDEAYYWVYSRFLDWGYFDHPPMIAVLIKMGTALFAGELGVRFFVVLMGTGTLMLIERLVRPQHVFLFFAIVLNLAVLQIGAIIAVPDIPLLFFTVLFFTAYERYTSNPTWLHAVFLALVIALLLYSKYHGILVILFTLLSNLVLLKKPMTWLVILLSFALFLPHVYWQAVHGFPSVNYHLFERLAPPYRVSFSTDFLVGQLLIAGPLLGWLFIWAAFRHKPENKTQQAMQWTMAGTYLLFFFSSFKSRTEANWTIPLIAPLIALSYAFLVKDEKKSRWVFKVLPYTLILVFLVRVYMFLDIPAMKFIPKDEFHQNKAWAASIREKSGGAPVVFTNSYQRASKYWFYTGDSSFSLNTYRYRRSNYNFWPLEAQLQNRKVMVVGSMGAAALDDSIQTPRGVVASTFLDRLHSNSQILIEQAVEGNATEASIDSAGDISVLLTYVALEPQHLDLALVHKPEIVLMIYPDTKSDPILVRTGKRIARRRDNWILVYLKAPAGVKKGMMIRWGLINAFVEPTINSRTYRLE